MEPEHHDPFSESGRAGLEKLMALGVLVEGGSRLGAERTRNRAAGQERDLARDQAARTAQEKARRLARAEQSRRERKWRTLVADPDRLAAHLRGLPVQEVARHWARAASPAGGYHGADAVLAASERELRARMPTLMDAYDRSRRGGAEPAEAMRSAAWHVFGGGRGRPHGGTVWWWSAGALPAVDRELEQELARSAGRLDPVARGRWLRSMQERGWSPESVAWAEATLTRSQDEGRAAAVDAAVVDDPDTPRDERVDGLTQAGAATGRADDLARDAAAVSGGAGDPAHQSTGAATQDTAGHAAHQAAGQPAGRPGAGGPGPPAQLARLSYPTPPQAVLRPAAPPPASARPRQPEHRSRKGRNR